VQSQPEVDEETRQVEHIFRRQNPPTIQQGSYQVCDLHEVELQVCAMSQADGALCCGLHLLPPPRAQGLTLAGALRRTW
jgi:hypothetical protein